MKCLVVCTNDNWVWHYESDEPRDMSLPVRGEIYEVTAIQHSRASEEVTYYKLRGFDNTYDTRSFRPIDDTYGQVIAEIIEKQVELEEMQKLSI